jgi:hypothetical protein
MTERGYAAVVKLSCSNCNCGDAGIGGGICGRLVRAPWQSPILSLGLPHFCSGLLLSAACLERTSRGVFSSANRNEVIDAVQLFTNDY